MNLLRLIWIRFMDHVQVPFQVQLLGLQFQVLQVLIQLRMEPLVSGIAMATHGDLVM